jgi:parallel beta-helix repeat protein
MKKTMNLTATLAARFNSTPHAPKRILTIWLSAMALALALGTQQLSAASVTHIVGTCKSGTQFSTIQAALDATPSPNTVEVCPGQYNEQITITKPVTLEGISSGNEDQVRIYTPGGGLKVNANVYTGDTVLTPAAAQIFVNNAGGSVNLANLVVNGTANGQSGSGAFVIGILYQQTPGTINHVITSNQNGQNTVGWGIFLQGGSSDPLVTVENCSQYEFSQGAIWAIGTTDTPNLRVAVENNVVSSASQSTYDIVMEESTNATVSGNVVSGGLYGIYVVGTEGSVSGNTILGSEIGIFLGTDGVSVKSNKIYGTILSGISIDAPSVSVSAVQGNTIRTVTNPNQGGGTGIDLGCNAVSSSLVHSNTFMDSNYGYGEAPIGFSGSNSYYGVFTAIDQISCAGGPNISGRSRAAALPRSPREPLQQ